MEYITAPRRETGSRSDDRRHVRSFAETLELHRRELRDHCRRMVLDDTAADDLAQETIIRAWYARHRFEGRCSLRTWLFRIATNACLDSLRRSGRSEVVDPLRLAHIPAPGRDAMDDVVERATAAAAFDHAVRCLPSRQRAVVVLCDGYGWSARDAAGAIDGTVASVNSALQRARATLRRHVVQPAVGASA